MLSSNSSRYAPVRMELNETSDAYSWRFLTEKQPAFPQNIHNTLAYTFIQHIFCEIDAVLIVIITSKAGQCYGLIGWQSIVGQVDQELERRMVIRISPGADDTSHFSVFKHEEVRRSL